MAEITFGGNFFIGGESAELKPFSIVSQVSDTKHLPNNYHSWVLSEGHRGHKKDRAMCDPALVCSGRLIPLVFSVLPFLSGRYSFGGRGTNGTLAYRH